MYKSIECKRQTGRTTRMLEKLYKFLSSDYKGCVMLVVPNYETGRRILKFYINKYKTIEHKERISIQPIHKGLFNQDPEYFSKMYNQKFVFIDPSAIESCFAEMLDLWCKYDKENFENKNLDSYLQTR